MAVCSVQWALLILLILKTGFSLSEETCKKINVCSCELSNGTKIDLKPVDETITGLKSAGSSVRTFDWNPCTPFKVAQCNQEHVLVAQIDGEDCYPAGTDHTSFSVEGTDIVITYGAITSGGGTAEAKRSTKITLKCDPTVTSKRGIWTDFEETNPDVKTATYSANYSSKYACATGSDSLDILF